LSRSARSTLTVSLTSWKVTSVAPSGSGMVVMSIIMPSRRSMRATIGSRLSIAVTAARKSRHTVLSSCIACAQAVTASTCGCWSSASGLSFHMRWNAGLCSRTRPSLPNTATASAK
jgi:hypothetical protein